MSKAKQNEESSTDKRSKNLAGQSPSFKPLVELINSNTGTKAVSGLGNHPSSPTFLKKRQEFTRRERRDSVRALANAIAEDEPQKKVNVEPQHKKSPKK